MANTTNLDLVKPLGTDHALVSVLNGNSDKIDAFAGNTNSSLNSLADGIAIVANGNTHIAITSGQFVYVKNHDTLAEGLYVATANISADGALSTSNLTADSSGGLNYVLQDIEALSDKITPQILSLSDIFNSLANNVTGSAVVAGNVITIYMQGDGIRNTSSGSDIGTLKQKYRPNLNTGHYIVTPILSNASPYLPVSSAWIYAGYGNIKKYGSEGFSISTTFVIEG